MPHQGRSCRGQRKTASQNAESRRCRSAACPGRWLQRLKGFPAWLRANRLRGSLAIAALTVGLIGLLVGLTLTFHPAARPTYIRQLAQAFAEYDKGNRAGARQMAAKLLTDTTVGYAEHGGATTSSADYAA